MSLFIQSFPPSDTEISESTPLMVAAYTPGSTGSLRTTDGTHLPVDER